MPSIKALLTALKKAEVKTNQDRVRNNKVESKIRTAIINHYAKERGIVIGQSYLIVPLIAGNPKKATVTDIALDYGREHLRVGVHYFNRSGKYKIEKVSTRLVVFQPLPKENKNA